MCPDLCGRDFMVHRDSLLNSTWTLCPEVPFTANIVDERVFQKWFCTAKPAVSPRVSKATNLKQERVPA